VCHSDGTCGPAVGGGGGSDGGSSSGNVGSSCTDGSQCSTGLCAVLGDNHFCTETCDPAGTTCPSGSHCVAADGQHICQPNNLASGGSGGGCSAAPGAMPGSEAMLAACILLLCGLGLAFRRARR
jgi:hypothetical protein